MATTLTEKSGSSRGLQLCQLLRTHVRPIASGGALRAALIAAVVAGVMMPVHTRSASQAASSNGGPAPCPLLKAKVDLAFIIDRSGSLDPKFQGETYNIQIEGVRRALLDPGVIPRDGSIAVAVFTFAGEPGLIQTFTEIKSAADAEAVAAVVEKLKCTNANGTCPQKGSTPESNVGNALLAANDHLNQNRRAGARQVFVVSSDGGFTQLKFADEVSGHLESSGLVSEINVILLGNELDPLIAKANADRIVFPEPTNALPGATLVIDADADCNKLGAAAECAKQSAPQVKKFAEFVRDALRSQVSALSFVVNTQADPDPGTPVGATLSLRQAIELANCNNGAATITFASNVKTISPRVPLPPLTAPDITICGCVAQNCGSSPEEKQGCKRSVTIDGSAIKAPADADGILIRSNRDAVRGLEIVNFPRAGVGIGSGLPSDNVGFNRIERNFFENNGKAGVCVLDPSPDPENAVVHNVGNTISMNDFSATGTPIDLACDGPTPNDLGDTDEGPNTLLNFPDKLDAAMIPALDVTAAASGVTLSGQLIGPTAARAVVEIFSITTFKEVPGGRLIDEVTFLAQETADADGRFSVTGLNDSLTCGYTATVTDLEGNTSELMFPCSGFGKAKVTDFDFGKVKPNQSRLRGIITIENIGCAPLTLKSYSVTRDHFGGDANDRTHFFIEEAPGKKGKSNRKFDLPIIIGVGQSRSFTVLFDPAIPPVQPTRNPPASNVLPDTITSTLTIDDDGCAPSDKPAHLTGLVDGEINLIDPKNPLNGPVVTLVRADDLFIVTYSIFDSDLNVHHAEYKFFDASGNSVPLDNSEADLISVVKQANLVKGQSFTVKQTFSNARQHKKATRVLVTVFDGVDGKGSQDMAFGSIGASTNGLSAQSVLDARGTVLVLPVVKLVPASKGTPASKRTRNAM